MDLLNVSLGKCYWYSDFKSQSGKSIVSIYHKTYQPLMSPGCPGMYYGSIQFGGKSMTKWYQGPELPPSCRCWRLKLKITTFHTPEIGCPGAMELYPRENSSAGNYCNERCRGSEKRTSFFSKIFFPHDYPNIVHHRHSVKASFLQQRVQVFVEKTYLSLLIFCFDRSNK